MRLSFPIVALKIESRVTVSDEMDVTKVVFILLSAALFVFLAVLVNRQFLKIFCACASEVCIFLACLNFFGSDSVITWIFRWITAAAACVLTVAVVNRIDWKQKKPDSEQAG